MPGSPIPSWVPHWIPQPYVGTLIFPVIFFHVPPLLLRSPSVSPHSSLGFLHLSLVQPQPSLISPRGPQVPLSPSYGPIPFLGSPHLLSRCQVPEPTIFPWGAFPSPLPSLHPLSLSKIPLPLPPPPPPKSPSLSPGVPPSHRGPTFRGVIVGAASQGTGGTEAPPGAELRSGHGDRSPVLLLALGGLEGTAGHQPLPGAAVCGDSDSGQYQWQDRVAERFPLNVTVLVPVANATITPGPLSHQVRAVGPVTLRCSVQVGSAPVTFTWLHNGQEVARGPLLELRDIDVGHSGTYQCVATNQLGQDGHCVF
ncbi:uncharacterized protein GJ701_017359 isoform 1-T3 [Geothlypis trichas]